jgi:hypothetical protein
VALAGDLGARGARLKTDPQIYGAQLSASTR